MFLSRAAPRPDPAALARVEALVRARFDVAEDDIVLVTEEPGREPGLPERMTTILFWTARTDRHRIRIFKPAAEIGADDLPQAYLRRAFVDDGEGDCC